MTHPGWAGNPSALCGSPNGEARGVQTRGRCGFESHPHSKDRTWSHPRTTDRLVSGTSGPANSQVFASVPQGQGLRNLPRTVTGRWKRKRAVGVAPRVGIWPEIPGAGRRPLDFDPGTGREHLGKTGGAFGSSRGRGGTGPDRSSSLSSVRALPRWGVASWVGDV